VAAIRERAAEGCTSSSDCRGFRNGSITTVSDVQLGEPPKTQKKAFYAWSKLVIEMKTGQKI